MPSPILHVPATTLQTSGGQTSGMIRQNAISNASDSICASLMIAKPHSASDVHHHGAQDTVIYAVAGHGAVVSDGGRERRVLAPGDFCLIPAYAEHQEVNDGDEEVVWSIVRSGREPVVENLKGWGREG